MKEKKKRAVFPRLQSVFWLNNKKKRVVNSYNMSIFGSNSYAQLHPFADIKYGKIFSCSSCLDWWRKRTRYQQTLSSTGKPMADPFVSQVGCWEGQASLDSFNSWRRHISHWLHTHIQLPRMEHPERKHPETTPEEVAYSKHLLTELKIHK